LSYPLQIEERVSYSHWQYWYGLNRHAHIFFRAGEKMPLPPHSVSENKTRHSWEPARAGGANSRKPFEISAFKHGERRCRPISPCAALRDGRHNDRRFPFL
jgi:hypothetical protein